MHVNLEHSTKERIYKDLNFICIIIYSSYEELEPLDMYFCVLCSRITCICVRFLSSDFSVKVSVDETTKNVAIKNQTKFSINRYRRKRPKVDASIFDSALSHTRRSEASEKREQNSVSTFGRFRLWTSFESPPVSVNKKLSRP